MKLSLRIKNYFWPFLAAFAFSVALITANSPKANKTFTGVVGNIAVTPASVSAIKPAPFTYLTSLTESSVSAKAALVADLKTLNPLFSKQSGVPTEPASLTKIATAVVALNTWSAKEILTVPATCLNLPGSSMKLMAGEKISLKSVLSGVLMLSASDATCVIYANFPGGQRGMVEEMNALSTRLNLKDTAWQNPIGFDDGDWRGNLSSAADLAALSREALKNEVFREIVGTSFKTVSSVDGSLAHPLQNINQLLGELPEVYGVKTGTTDLAGQCLVTALKYKERDFIVVVLGSSDRYADTRKLIAWLQSSVTW